MAKNKVKHKTSYAAPQRLNEVESERSHKWLSFIFDAYYTADEGIYEAMESEMKKGFRLACSKGCSACCKTHVTIPVYPLELMGIYWFMMCRVSPNNSEIILHQLMHFFPGKGCPYLVEGACGIHSVRPLACRFFNVFTKPCEENEDPYYSRRRDVWTPDEKLKNKAVSKMLPYYGFTQRSERREAMKAGYMIRFVKNMQDINWPSIASRLKNRDWGPIEKDFHP